MNSHIEHRAARFLDHVTRLDPDEWHDAFFTETIETGGTYMIPEIQRDAASHLVEIHLHDITAYGTNEEEAQRSWIKQARRTLRAEASSATERTA